MPLKFIRSSFQKRTQMPRDSFDIHCRMWVNFSFFPSKTDDYAHVNGVSHLNVIFNWNMFKIVTSRQLYDRLRFINSSIRCWLLNCLKYFNRQYQSIRSSHIVTARIKTANGSLDVVIMVLITSIIMILSNTH